MPSATEIHLLQFDDLVPYGRALALQHELRERLLEGESVEGRGGYLIALEHPPVVTLGKRGERTDLVAREALDEAGIEVFEIERGGEATYHGPGQLVLYPILELDRFDLGVVDVVRGLADGIAHICEQLDVEAGYDTDHPGVWTHDAPREKLASVGMRVRKGVTTHGAAINIVNDMEPFSMIVPCGMPEAPMTRLADRVDGESELLEPERFADPLIEHVADLTDAEIVESTIELPPEEDAIEPVS